MGSPEVVTGLLGLGHLGRAIAARLLDDDATLLVWNRSAEACDAVAERGAEPVASVAELVERCDLVLLCLDGADAVEEVVFGTDGVAAVATEEQLLIDLSATGPAATRRFARELAQRSGMGWVDAPVLGDLEDAEQGTLVAVAGGDEDDVERARPLLGRFCSRVTHMGEAGAGQAARLCHALLAGAGVLALAETVAWAERNGVDTERLPEALAGAPADSPLLQRVGTRMAVREFEPLLATTVALRRELELALDGARASGAALPLAALTAQLLRQQALRARPEEDLATLVELYTE